MVPERLLGGAWNWGVYLIGDFGVGQRLWVECLVGWVLRLGETGGELCVYASVNWL